MFSIDGLSKSSSIVDETKMRWLNAQYVKELPFAEYVERATPWLDKTSAKGLDYNFLCSLLHSRTEIFSQIPELVSFHDTWEGFDLALFEHKKMKTDAQVARELLPQLVPVLVANQNVDTLYDELVAWAAEHGVKNGQVFWTLRIAITGAMTTPGGATDMVKLLGKDVCLARIEKVLERLA